MSEAPETPPPVESGDEQQKQRRSEILKISLPGVTIRITDATLRTIFEFTGQAWKWVVYALAAAIVLYSLGYTYQAFKT